MAKVADRLLLFIYSLAIIVVSVYALMLAFGGITDKEAGEQLQYMYRNSAMQYTWIACSLVLLLISVRFFYLSVRRGRGQTPSIDQRTDYGDIRISLDTVENLSLRAANRIRGVKELKSRVKVSSAGLEVIIRMIVDGESPIPAMTEEIQASVKSYIEEITGIPVAVVSVFVANVAPSQVTFKSRVE
ncbi:MAG: hypothetical protein K0R75_143 [Paenibacillaceae bacterium]|nr:hypothetical protein [Paenibacillaceae bacterium]